MFIKIFLIFYFFALVHGTFIIYMYILKGCAHLPMFTFQDEDLRVTGRATIAAIPSRYFHVITTCTTV